MLSHHLRLAWHIYHQEKHQPHQRFLAWTFTLLMVFILTLSQVSDNIQTYLTQNLNNLLGADLVIHQTQPLQRQQLDHLAGISNQVVLTQSVVTTLTHQQLWQRANLKAVGNDYPLQGHLRTSLSLQDADESSLSGPQTGHIWLDPRLLASLSLNVGDSLRIANQVFSVSRVLQHEPDRLMEGHNVDMRALIHRQDFARLSLTESTIEHRYLVSATADQITQIRNWQKDHLPHAQVYHKQGAHPLAQFWQRTENFIGLASIILFFMAAIAIAQLTQVQMRKEQYFSAVCLSLGASKTAGLYISVVKWLCRLLFLFPRALLLSALCHWLIVQWLTGTFVDLEWQPDILLAGQTLIACSIIFLVFNLPLWLGLRQASVRQLIYNTPHNVRHGVLLGCALLVLAAVAATYSDNVLLTTMVLTAMVVSIVLMLISSYLTLTLGERLTQNVSGLVPFALFMMKQRLLSKTTQILGVGLCAFLLLFTLMLLRDLGNSMQAYQRQHDGNLLVSQASDVQMADIASWAARHDVRVRQHKPFMYAKLTKINNLHLTDFSQTPSESLATFSRPVRLHWSDAVPANNEVVDGQWWQQDTQRWQQVSMEQEVMTDLGLHLGDTLTFYIAQQAVDFILVASHAYKPGAGSITFWVQMPPAALQHIQAPHFSMASLELAPEQFSLLSNLWQQHPSLRMVSLKEMTQRFDTTLAMVTKIISGFAILISLLAGIVIVSSVHALEGKERKKNSIIMSFGFSRATCFRLNLIEWLATGAIAACGAILGTWIAGLLIYQSQFSMAYQPDLLWMAATLLLILTVVTALGVIVSKKSLSGSIRQLLAES